jgi:hypothetical protein
MFHGEGLAVSGALVGRYGLNGAEQVGERMNAQIGLESFQFFERMNAGGDGDNA